jgi:hypothetical protein
MGCSPMAIAAPVIPKWLCAMTATLESGNYINNYQIHEYYSID